MGHPYIITMEPLLKDHSDKEYLKSAQPSPLSVICKNDELIIFFITCHVYSNKAW